MKTFSSEPGSPTHIDILSTRTVKTPPTEGGVLFEIHMIGLRMPTEVTMRQITLITLLGLSLLVSACSTSRKAATATPEAIPTIVSDTAIIAEGHLEPIRCCSRYRSSLQL